MRSSKLPKKIGCSDLFLYRTLSFNKSPTRPIISEYYLHTITKNVTKNDLIKILKDFQLTRKKEENCHLVIVNNLNLKTLSIELDDKDYFISILACFICKRSFNNIAALIIHYYFIHSEYNYSQTKIQNQYTNMKETHLILSLKQDTDIIIEKCNDQKFLKIISDKYNRFEEVSKIISSLEISKINWEMSHEIQIKKRESSNKSEFKLKKYVTDPNAEKIFFHNYTGEVFDPFDPEMDFCHFEIEEDYMKLLEKEDIDAQNDTNEKQKDFFKLWNDYIYTCGVIPNNQIESKVLNFIQLYSAKLLRLKEQLLIHLRTLFDYSLLTKNQLINIFFEIRRSIN